MGRPLYEAVPDDVVIEKLTIGQRDALARYRRHENINTFLGNENTPIVVGGLIGTFILGLVVDDVIQNLKDEGVAITEATVQAVKKTSTAINPAAYLWKVAQFGVEEGTEVGLGIRKFFEGDKP